MPLLSVNLAALTIAVLYYAWRDHVVKPAQRRKMLRERVTYMLWCAANQPV
jgi:hypothetical protein